MPVMMHEIESLGRRYEHSLFVLHKWLRELWKRDVSNKARIAREEVQQNSTSEVN